MSTLAKITWPLSIRIIHWVVAVVFFLDAFFIEDADDNIHVTIGYLAVALVVIRLIMGFTGKGHVNFKNFPLGFKELITFLPRHLKREVHYEGHNPFASLVYLFMWLGFLILGVSGYMLGTETYWGDETVEAVHSYTSDAIAVLVLLHLGGIIMDSILYKRKSWMGMIK